MRWAPRRRPASRCDVATRKPPETLLKASPSAGGHFNQITQGRRDKELLGSTIAPSAAPEPMSVRLYAHVATSVLWAKSTTMREVKSLHSVQACWTFGTGQGTFPSPSITSVKMVVFHRGTKNDQFCVFSPTCGRWLSKEHGSQSNGVAIALHTLWFSKSKAF